jgi:hypothetical protein
VSEPTETTVSGVSGAASPPYMLGSDSLEVYCITTQTGHPARPPRRQFSVPSSLPDQQRQRQPVKPSGWLGPGRYRRVRRKEPGHATYRGRNRRTMAT